MGDDYIEDFAERLFFGGVINTSHAVECFREARVESDTDYKRFQNDPFFK